MTTTASRRILVVTPTLGDSRFLDETVASVTRQSVEIHHVIASPTGAVERLRARFPHATVLPDAGKAGGIYGALNAALAGAPGDWEWFTYINDDDALRTEFSAMFARQQHAPARADVIYGDVDLVDEEGRTLTQITTERNPRWIPALLQQGISPLMQQGMLFRRAVVERLGGFDTRYRLCADLDFWLRAYADGARFQAHALRVAHFRLRRGQLSGDTTLTDREQMEIVTRHLPRRVSRVRRCVARVRYRLFNLPRYAARVQARGLRTSYEVLQTEGARR